jgi:hypothetical protein
MVKSHPYVAGLSLIAAFNSNDRQIIKTVLIGALFLVAVTAFAILVVWPFMVLMRRYEARRTRQIQAVLGGLGFTLHQERDELYLRFFGLFKIGQRGHSRRISNRFESALHPDGITQLMDYSFEEGSGKGRRAFRQTVAVIANKQFELPAFVLAPEKFFSRLFGAKDIDFDANPTFNRMFKLQGDNEAAVRAMFTPTVIEELERHPDITLEGRGGNLLVFRAGKRAKPEDYPQFHQEAQELAQLFLQ